MKYVREDKGVLVPSTKRSKDSLFVIARGATKSGPCLEVATAFVSILDFGLARTEVFRAVSVQEKILNTQVRVRIRFRSSSAAGEPEVTVEGD